jgi:two-component system, NarL family, nitrate/nitrite response regulator NarL
MTTQTADFVLKNQFQADTIHCGAALKVNTVLVCENALLRNGIQQILSGTPFFVTDDGSVARPGQIRNLAQEPALFIITVGQDLKRVLDTAQQAREQFPNARIVALADHFEPMDMLQGREAGIDGFCLTATSREVLIKSLELVMLGEAILPSKVVCSLLSEISVTPRQDVQVYRPLVTSKLSNVGAHKLSARETEILSCLMDGAPNKVIARRLDVAEATIKVHVKAILRKIGAVNRTQAAMWATEHLPASVGASISG